MVSQSSKVGLGLLILVALVGLGFLLGMAIRGELTRVDDTSKIAKLIVLVNSPRRMSATENANFLRERYSPFFSVEVDIDLAFVDTGSNRMLIDAILTDLKPTIVGGDQNAKITSKSLGSDQTLTDKLFEWLSAEGTLEDSENVETVVKQFYLMTLPQSKIDFILSRMGAASDSKVNMLIFEAWPKGVKMGYVAVDENKFHQLISFDSLEAARKQLCPGSESHYLYCTTNV